jgi:cbb3-type cytochrome oxidase cytochrome c subunit
VSSTATKLPITLEALKEMQKTAMTERIVGIEKQDYVEAQQIMVITALIKYLESFGLEASFKIEL